MSTYYVNADSGSDAAAGTVGAPWKTINYALSAGSTAGDTIILQDAAATYSFPLARYTPTSRTICADVLGDAVIDQGNGTVDMPIGANTTINFQNLIVQNVTQGAVQYGSFTHTWAGGAGPATYNFTSCIFRDWHMTMAFYNGYHQVGDPAGSTVGMVLNSCILNNFVKAAGGTYPCFFMTWESESYITMYNCTLHTPGTTVGGTLLGGVFMGAGGGYNYGITFKNSIIYAAEAIPFKDWAYVPSAVVDYCCLYNITSPPAGTGNITSDPLLVDPVNNNLKLRPTSPCIGVGTIL